MYQKEWRIEVSGFAVGGNMRFILAGKAAQDWRNRWVMVPGIGGLLRLG